MKGTTFLLFLAICLVILVYPHSTRTALTTGNLGQAISDYKADRLTMPTLLDALTVYRSNMQTVQTLSADFATFAAAHPPLIGQNGYVYESARAIDAYLTMYESTGNTTYLDSATAALDLELSHWPWTGGDWTAKGHGLPANDTAQGGDIIRSYTRYAALTKTLGYPYSSKGATYYAFAKPNFLDIWENSFKNFTLTGQAAGCLPNLGSKYVEPPYWACDRWNAAANVMEAFLYADRYTAQPRYTDLLTRQATFFKLRGLHTLSPCPGFTDVRYSWGYRAQTNLTGEYPFTEAQDYGFFEYGDIEPLNYAVFDLRYVDEMRRANIVFTDGDLDLLAASLVQLGNQNASEPYRMFEMRCWTPQPGTLGNQNAYYTGYLQGAYRYVSRNPALATAYATIYTKIKDNALANPTGQGTYYQCAYDHRDQYVCPANTPGLGKEMMLQLLADHVWAATHS